MDKYDDFDGFEDFEDFEETDEIIVMEDEFGNEREFFIIDGLSHKGSNYLLVAPADSDEDEYEASIIKEVKDSDSNISVYELVENDNEFNEVAAIFASSEGDYEINI